MSRRPVPLSSPRTGANRRQVNCARLHVALYVDAILCRRIDQKLISSLAPSRMYDAGCSCRAGAFEKEGGYCRIFEGLIGFDGEELSMR